MKNNKLLKDLIHEAIKQTQNQFALQDTKRHLIHAINCVDVLDKKRERREIIQKEDALRREVIQKEDFLNFMNPKESLSVIDELIKQEQQKLNSIKSNKQQESEEIIND